MTNCRENNTGYIKLTLEGNVSFDFNDFYIEIVGSKQLREIYSVKEFDKNNGYIVIDTNYGEESYGLLETIEDMGLADRVGIKQKLSNIEQFVVA